MENKNISYIDSNIRYKWVDIMRFFGIFAIYLGHFGNAAGKLYPFVFEYHVAMFFMISGFFAFKGETLTVKDKIIKRIRSLILPYYFFCLLNLTVIIINENCGLRRLMQMLIQSLGGIRNNIFAGSLWFLPCLFIIEIVFDLIYTFLLKIHANYIRTDIFLISILGFIVNRTFFPKTPSWFYNIDTAACYLLYYVIGAIIFPYLIKGTITRFKTIISFLPMGVVTIIVYFKGSGKILNLFRFLPYLIRIFIPVLITLCIIAVIYFYAILIERYQRSNLLSQIGTETLILCGIETSLKITVATIIEGMGGKLTLSTPYVTLLYTFFLLLIAHKIVIPFINPCLTFIKNKSMTKLI